MTDPRGTLFVVSGPSGVGKGTVVRHVLRRVPRLHLSVSATTRAPRQGESDGVHYLFVTDEAFDRMIAEEEFLEWAEVFGARYGTPAGPIREALFAGRDAVLEIDVQGARQVREAVADAVLIFLAPPSLEELERRLRSRGTEDDRALAGRVHKAGWELGQQGWFDYVIVNDDLERTSARVAAIIEGFPASHEGRTHP